MSKHIPCRWRHQGDLTRDPRPPRALVAEDEPDVRRLVAAALRGLGYDIVEACSGTELLHALGDRLLSGDADPGPDVIVADIRMPGLTGLEILAGLRQTESPTPIVLMTAYHDREIREEAQRLGANAFLEKPFDLDDLLAAVVNNTPARETRGAWDHA